MSSAGSHRSLRRPLGSRGRSPSNRGFGACRDRPRAGLTLLEVMVAVMIIGVAFVALLQAAASCLSIVVAAKDFEAARVLLERLEQEEPLQIDEIDGNDQDGGRFDGDYRDFRWKRVIAEVGEESDELYQITTTITWERGDEEWKEEVSRLLHLPSARRNGWIDENAD